MPRGDGTGPAGLGPMTGRAAGFCAGYDAPGYANPVPRRYAGVPGRAEVLPRAGVPVRAGGYRPRGGGRGMGRGRGRMGWNF